MAEGTDSLQITEVQPTTDDNDIIKGPIVLTQEEINAPQPPSCDAPIENNQSVPIESTPMEDVDTPEEAQGDEDMCNEGGIINTVKSLILGKPTPLQTCDNSQRRGILISSIKRLIRTGQVTSKDLTLLNDSKEVLQLMKYVGGMDDDELDLFYWLLRGKIYENSPWANPVQLVQRGLAAASGFILGSSSVAKQVREDRVITASLDELTGDSLERVTPVLKLATAIGTAVIDGYAAEAMRCGKREITVIDGGQRATTTTPTTAPKEAQTSSQLTTAGGSESPTSTTKARPLNLTTLIGQSATDSGAK